MTIRELNGWSPTASTFDADGRLISTTTTEPRFDDRERALLWAAWADKNEPRGPHGIPMVEAMDPANQFGFEVIGPRVDWAQSVINKAKAAHQKAAAEDDTRAVVFGVRKV